MEQVRAGKPVCVFEQALFQPGTAMFSLFMAGALSVLERLHIYSAPVIISAECLHNTSALPTEPTYINRQGEAFL